MEKVLIASIIVVATTIFSGAYFYLKGTEATEGKLRKFIKINLAFFIPIMTFFAISLTGQTVEAASAGGDGSGLGFIAAGISTGLAALGAGIAVSSVGSSAIGAVSEDPKILGKSMIFLGLAEGIAIYGLIISIMILGRL
ncbi:ATP synthase subunit C [Peptoniphilus catoniae]|uniref:ATP synthase subunit C n=1 Tax=Peptoniphilus catoniae TaxID=1660341 RepID=UPI0010FEE67B|nr:ATP synthase subunit C [Peptoniphilus catoniae]